MLDRHRTPLFYTYTMLRGEWPLPSSHDKAFPINSPSHLLRTCVGESLGTRLCTMYMYIPCGSIKYMYMYVHVRIHCMWPCMPLGEKVEFPEQREIANTFTIIPIHFRYLIIPITLEWKAQSKESALHYAVLYNLNCAKWLIYGNTATLFENSLSLSVYVIHNVVVSCFLQCMGYVPREGCTIYPMHCKKT